MDENLKQKAILGVFWQAIQRFGSRVILFVANMVFARLLSPDDFGCMGIIWVFLSFSDIFINGGFGSALIQKKDISENDYSTAFYWNFIIAFLCYCILYFCAPSIADFYSTPILSEALRVQGLVLFFNSLCVVQVSRLYKQLKFKKIAIIDVVASILGSAIGIFCAYLGLGVWSFVIKMLSYGVINSILIWISAKWCPNFVFSLASFKKLFGFGSFMFLSSLTNVLFINFQSLIIGKMFTMKDLAYYSQARKLEEVPIVCLTNIISTVSYPVFSTLQEDKDMLLTCIRRNIKTITFLSFPLMTFFIVAAEPIIMCVFSEKWLPSVPYFQLLCLAGVLIPINITNRDFYAAIGRSKLFFNSQLIYKLFGIGMMLIGIYSYGVTGLLIGKIIADYCLFFMNATITGRLINYGVIRQIRDLATNLLISVFCGVLFHYIMKLYHSSSVWILLLECLVFFTLYLSIAYIGKNNELFLYLNIIKNTINKIRKH